MGKKKVRKIGAKVMHKIHGPGRIIAQTEDPHAVVVKFNQPIAKWGTDTLEVSATLLTKRWGRLAEDQNERDPEAPR